MAEKDKPGLDRRTFLKTAAASAGVAASAPVLAQSSEAAKPKKDKSSVVSTADSANASTHAAASTVTITLLVT